MTPLLVVSAFFLSAAFWIGHQARTAELQAFARAREGYGQEGTWSLYMTADDGGTVTVRAVFKEPIMVDSVAVWPSGEMVMTARGAEQFETVLRQARERAAEAGTKREEEQSKS